MSKVTNSGKLLENLTALHNRLAARLVPALAAGAQELLDRSLDLVPRDTEALADSGHKRQIGSGLQTQFIVGYGSLGDVFGIRLSLHGSTAGQLVSRHPYDYASVVHEDMEMKHDPGQQAKFLEQPLYMNQREIIVAINQSLGV